MLEFSASKGVKRINIIQTRRSNTNVKELNFNVEHVEHGREAIY